MIKWFKPARDILTRNTTRFTCLQDNNIIVLWMQTISVWKKIIEKNSATERYTALEQMQEDSWFISGYSFIDEPHEEGRVFLIFSTVNNLILHRPLTQHFVMSSRCHSRAGWNYPFLWSAGYDGACRRASPRARCNLKGWWCILHGSTWSSSCGT